jgi:DNA-binding HxlR family transcriptional regulator
MVSNGKNLIGSDCCKMRSKGGYCPRPLERASSFLTKKWMISIIITIGNHKVLRFNDISQRVTGITSKILTERLKELQKESVIQREVFKEIPPRVEYSLTKSGKSLFVSLVPLMEWAETRS